MRRLGWTLIAGEYPGGSDHELYPLNVVDPTVARDRSPDPRRHSLGELIPDVVAIRERQLIIAEAKVSYNQSDREKLEYILGPRRADLLTALHKFAHERDMKELLPIDSLILCPVLVFLEESSAPPPTGSISYLRIRSSEEGYIEGKLSDQDGP